MRKYKVGDRVIDEYLGAGEVVAVMSSVISGDNVYSVMFDKTPDVKFNMGNNPSMSFPWNLEAENE